MGSKLILLGAGASKWTPKKLGLGVYYRSKDALPVGGGVIANNDPIETWLDASGNGVTLAQATAAKRFTYKSNVQNGNAVVEGDGVDDTIEAALPVALQVNSYTCFLIAKLTVGNKNIFSLGDVSPTQYCFMYTSGFIEFTSFCTSGNDAATGAVDRRGAFHLFVFRRSVAENRLDVYCNSITPEGSNVGLVNATATYGTTKKIYLGSRFNTGFATGQFAEFGICPRDISMAELTKLIAYAKRTWGTP